jgi:hypothetical protein
MNRMVKALLCRVPYRFVMALLGIEMAVNRNGEAGISGARVMTRIVSLRHCTERSRRA